MAGVLRGDGRFEWACPSWGCLGVLLRDSLPRHGDTATCERDLGDDRPNCGRVMRWNAHLERWEPPIR